jgi:hypothetical protein
LVLAIVVGVLSASRATYGGVVPDPPGGPACLGAMGCRAFRFVEFSSSQKGYVSDGANLFRTDDAGATWVPVLGDPSPLHRQLGWLSIVDHDVFVVGMQRRWDVCSR